ncbi:hypothetical protein ABK040_013467 [Willaertia magna]
MPRSGLGELKENIDNKISPKTKTLSTTNSSSLSSRSLSDRVLNESYEKSIDKTNTSKSISLHYPVTIIHEHDGEEFKPGFYGIPTIDDILEGDFTERIEDHQDFKNTYHKPKLTSTKSSFASPNSKEILSKAQLQSMLSLCITFAKHYENVEMRLQRELQQDQFLTTFQLSKLGKHSPAFEKPNSPYNPRSMKGTHLFYQKEVYHFFPTPQKLCKTWNEDDVKITDVFLFSIPFEEVEEQRMNIILQKLKKHIKYITKEYVITPMGHNGRGRKVFLQDLKNNILPKTLITVEELKNMADKHGYPKLKYVLSNWKTTNDRKDVCLTHENLLEVVEYIKIHIVAEQFRQIEIK